MFWDEQVPNTASVSLCFRDNSEMFLLQTSLAFSSVESTEIPGIFKCVIMTFE